MLVLRTVVFLMVKLAALFSLVIFQAVSVIRHAIDLMIVVLILLKSVHVSKNSDVYKYYFCQSQVIKMRDISMKLTIIFLIIIIIIINKVCCQLCFYPYMIAL